MKDKKLDAFAMVSKAKYEAEEALKQLENARDGYKDAKVTECVNDILNVLREEGKLTERDLMLFIGALAMDIKQIYFK